MKNNLGLRISTMLSIILNIILGAVIFAWLDANASTALATVAGLAVVALGLVFSVSFPGLVAKGDK